MIWNRSLEVILYSYFCSTLPDLKILNLEEQFHLPDLLEDSMSKITKFSHNLNMNYLGLAHLISLPRHIQGLIDNTVSDLTLQFTSHPELLRKCSIFIYKCKSLIKDIYEAIDIAKSGETSLTVQHMNNYYGKLFDNLLLEYQHLQQWKKIDSPALARRMQGSVLHQASDVYIPFDNINILREMDDPSGRPRFMHFSDLDF